MSIFIFLRYPVEPYPSQEGASVVNSERLVDMLANPIVKSRDRSWDEV